MSNKEKKKRRVTYRITRTDRDAEGREYDTLVSYTNDACEVGCIIDGDRKNIDWDADYHVIPEEE